MDEETRRLFEFGVEEVDGPRVSRRNFAETDLDNGVVRIPSLDWFWRWINRYVPSGLRKGYMETARGMVRNGLEHEIKVEVQGRPRSRREEALLEAERLYRSRDPFGMAYHLMGLENGVGLSRLVNRYLDLRRYWNEGVEIIKTYMEHMLGVKPMKPAYATEVIE